MNVVEDNNISVGGGASAVIDNVAKDDAILGRGNFHICLDAAIGEIVKMILSNVADLKVWPDFAKFRHFGKIFKVLGYF